MATATALTVPQVAVPAPPHTAVQVIDADVNLAAASLANIPLNLLIDLVNIPYSEWQAADVFAQAQLWGGSWLVVGPSNIFGTDPADAVRFMALAAMLVPFPALSGLDPDAPLDADHPLGVLAGDGLAQMFWRFLAAELPVDPSCDAEGCVPTTPVAPITGIRGLDNSIWNFLLFTGGVRFPLISGFFKVGLSQLINGNFDQVEDPSGKVNNVPGFNFPGTIDGPNGENFMPWAGIPINLDLVKPFANYLNHLMADPAGNPVQLPNLEQVGRTLQTLIAGMVIAFDPFTPGSPLCPGYCADLPASQDYPAIVKVIGDSWPGNAKIAAWLQAYDQGIANTPMGQYVTNNINLFRLGEKFWDFSNKPLDPQFSHLGFNPSDLAPAFYKFWKTIGLNPDPLYPGGDTTTTTDVPTPMSTKAAAEPTATNLVNTSFTQRGLGRMLETARPDTTTLGAPVPMDNSDRNVTSDESDSAEAAVRPAGSSTGSSSHDGADETSGRSGHEDAVVGDEDDAGNVGAGEDAGAVDVRETPKDDGHARDTDNGDDAAGGGRQVDNDSAGSDQAGSDTHAAGGDHAGDDSGVTKDAA